MSAPSSINRATISMGIALNPTGTLTQNSVLLTSGIVNIQYQKDQ